MKYLALAQKGTKRKKGKAIGRKAVIKGVKGEIEVLREGRTVPSDDKDSEPHEEVEEKVTWSSSRN